MLFGVDDKLGLARLLAVAPAEIDYVLSRLPRYYRDKKTAKRDGSPRKLYVPQGKLKALQDKIKDHILDAIEWPPWVHGGIKRRSILTSALPHVSQAVVFSLDVKDFFPSVNPERVRRSFELLGFARAPATILAKATTWQFQLPQGASTSQALANLALIKADWRIKCLADIHGFFYTRFVDDLVLSGGYRLLKFRWLIGRIIESEGFKVKENKIATSVRGGRQTVLGLVVNNKLNVSSDYRSLVRQEVFEHLTNEPEVEAAPSLRGKVEWLKYVNPEVGGRLAKRLEGGH